MFDHKDTIVAIATPPGQGALGIVRLSGHRAIEFANRFFFGEDLSKVPGNTIHFGHLKDEKGEIIDECLVSVFRKPKSYTKQDSVEFSCHGSSYILQEVVRIFIKAGARLAEPGEYTLRAFLNGQMDLSQAEAVADLISAENAINHQMAMSQMRGGFSGEIKKLRDRLIEFASLLELELDFSEEDVEFAERQELKNLISEIITLLTRLIASFALGNVLKSGVSSVIAGRPNAGKSTLLNALVNEERAIVSDIPGTTRDTIEESLIIKGLQFRFIDTAGIRSARNIIEKEGVERTIDEISKSSIVIYVFDVSSTEPKELWKDVQRFLIGSKKVTHGSKKIFVANKADLGSDLNLEDYYYRDLISKDNLVAISAKNRENIEEVRDLLYRTIIEEPTLVDQTIVTNSRHVSVLSKALEALETVITGLENDIPSDLIAIDIRQSLYHLGQITGEISTDDLLESIFSNFCIGK